MGLLQNPSAVNTSPLTRTERFGRVRIWFDESPVSLTASLALALVVFGLFWFLAMRPARAPSALMSLALQPVMDDRGLQGATPGQRDADESGAQHDPLSNSVPTDSAVSSTSAPEMEDEDPTDRPSKLKLDLESGNVAETLREAASDLENAQAMLRGPRDESESEAPRDASQPKGKASATEKTKGLMRGSGRLPTASGGENRSGDMGSDGTGKQSARFFGLGAEDTNSVVYVIDCSGSMGRPPQKFLMAQKELMRSIQALRPNQSFFVIFFNDRMIPMHGAEMRSATDGNKDEVCEWIATAFSGGGTNPLPALNQALQLQPETIYVLSDGLFKGQYVREVQQRNRGEQRATIYTIGFGDRSGEVQLERLARENGGSYRFVRRDEDVAREAARAVARIDQ